METKENPNQRTCIVTRQTRQKEQLIRFVLDPENRVVPDLKEKLPGRGVWIIADKDAIAKAATKGLFKGGFKCKSARADDLVEMVEKGLIASILGRLALAKKSGLAITGFSKVEIQARLGKIAILFHAGESGSDGRKKLVNALQSCERDGGYKKGLPPICEALSGEQLDTALGGSNMTHVALLRSGMTTKLAADVNRLGNFQALD